MNIRNHSITTYDRTFDPFSSSLNSFVSIIEPKRTSLDIRLFLQMHRKKTRNNLIQNRFELNNSSFNFKTTPNHKGFKGSKVQFQKRTKINRLTTLEIPQNPSTCKEQNIIKQRMKTQGSHRPNMMYNLTLYRKKFKEKCFNSNKQDVQINLQVRQKKK